MKHIAITIISYISQLWYVNFICWLLLLPRRYSSSIRIVAQFGRNSAACCVQPRMRRGFGASATYSWYELPGTSWVQGANSEQRRRAPHCGAGTGRLHVSIGAWLLVQVRYGMHSVRNLPCLPFLFRCEPFCPPACWFTCPSPSDDHHSGQGCNRHHIDH